MMELACRNERLTAQLWGQLKWEEVELIVELIPMQKEKRIPLRRARERFEASPQWKSMRRLILERDGKKCVKCESVKQPTVDHILPKSKVPSLALDEINLRVLCWDCNKSKAAKVEIDFVLSA